MAILDSGERTEFSTGAVRDVQEGKGRCDLLPLGEIADIMASEEIREIEMFRKTGDKVYLQRSLDMFLLNSNFSCMAEMIWEVAKHFEEGCKKYGPNNWMLGIPISRYMDSGIRHYLKVKMGMTDERHDRAFVWNILCAMWTYENLPEMDDFTAKKEVKE